MKHSFSRRLASDYATFSLLRDGRSCALRAIRPSDEQHLIEAFERFAAAAPKQRFFWTSQPVTPEDIRSLVAPDFETEVVLVAVIKAQDRDRIIGIGHYRLADWQTRTAKAAFIVARELQGFGISTLLLEHLASIARSADIDRFEVEAEEENTAILDLLGRSGLELERRSENGIVHVTVTTENTTPFVRSNTARAMKSAAESMRKLLAPASVALVGASRRKDSIGGALTANLFNPPFSGKTYLVNPAAEQIDGRKCYGSVKDIGEPIDLALIAVPAAHVLKVVQECADAGVRNVVIISAGFAEVSEEGRALEQQLKAIVRTSGMRMVGPNCFGILNTNPAVSLNGTFSPIAAPRGRVGMLSQSGALGLAILDYANTLKIGISTFVSVGNKTDVAGNDLLSYWAADPDTDVIALYLESFGDARLFGRLAPEVARRKPIVAVKSGRSAAGSRAASSHSAALASLDVAVDALFQQAGVIRTNTLEELFGVVALLSSQPPPAGPRVGVVTNAGGPGILLADALEAHNLKLPQLAEPTLAELRTFLPRHAGYSNPIDMIASAGPEEYKRVITAVGKDPNVDSVIAIYIPPTFSNTEAIVSSIAEAAGNIPPEKPILTVYLSSKGAPPSLSSGPRGQIPAFGFPENAAQALAAAERYSNWRNKPKGSEIALSNQARTDIRRIIEEVVSRTAEPQWLSNDEINAIFSALEIPSAQSAQVPASEAPQAATRIGYPVVLKAVSKQALHKSDIGAVILNLNNEDEVRKAAALLEQRLASAGATLEGVLVQQQINGGVEAIVGVTTDPTFGPIVVCGLGGTQVELLKDVSFRLPPVTDRDAQEMIESLRAKKLLYGYRGSKPCNIQSLISIITKISALCELVPEIRELDLNPIKVTEQSSFTVDARIRIGTA